MGERVTEEDLELLGELGVEVAPEEKGGRTPRDQRIIAGFEEIVRFVEEHGRAPQHGEGRDIFERLYAVRLDRLRALPECLQLLKDYDTRGLLAKVEPEAAPAPADQTTDEALLASLGVEAPQSGEDINRLVHVRSREEVRAAEEIAKRASCKDFHLFKPLFEQVQRELETGERLTIKYQDNAEIRKDDLFIVDGQKALVVEAGEEFVSGFGRLDRRLRVVYDNGTENELLGRSLMRALNRDKASRRIIDAGPGPLFSTKMFSDGEEQGDSAAGCIYVLRSKSLHPFVAENRNVIHKIGVTGGDVSKRVAIAKKDPTYLLADVEIVATYKLANVNRKLLETLLHRFFSSARLDVELKDRFGSQVEPKEWFLIPLQAINEAIQRLIEGTLSEYRYDPETARVLRA